MLVTNAPAVASVSNLSTFPITGASVAAPVSVLPVNGGNSFVNVPGAGQWSTVNQQQPSLFPASGNQSTPQPFVQSVAGPSSNQVDPSALLSFYFLILSLVIAHHSPCCHGLLAAMEFIPCS